MLVNGFPVTLPGLPVVGDQDVVAASDEIVGDIGVRAVGVDSGFLVDELFDQGAGG